MVTPGWKGAAGVPFGAFPAKAGIHERGLKHRCLDPFCWTPVLVGAAMGEVGRLWPIVRGAKRARAIAPACL